MIFPLFVPLSVVNPQAALDLGSGQPGLGLASAPASVGGEKSYSDIPGAPGHPADHDCFPCQILKYLVSFLVSPQLSLLSPSVQHAVLSGDWSEPPDRYNVLLLPPSRAPPQPV